MHSDTKNLVVILGPTGVGKSRTALRLAHRFPSEVINCDSMQVYRGFDIGTDKLPPDAREGIPHHLLDIVDPSVQFTAADFVRASDEAARDITARGRLPLITGGTGLYLKALIEGLFPEGRRDESLRAQLEQEAKAHGLEYLWKQLEGVDPDYASKIGPRDRIRIIRALEVYRATGSPLSSHFPRTRSLVADFHSILIGLNLDRTELYDRINRRVERMFAEGMVEEVRRLLASGVSDSAPPFRALGYRQVLRFFEGELSEDEAVDLTKRETRHYAKRQLTWFRKMEGIRWFSPSEFEAISAHISSNLI